LRIGEVSTFAGSNGQAMPGVVSINENIFKKNIQNPASFNVIARLLTHEISHQWWGLLLTPKRIEGAKFMSESLAKYSETVILEKLYGKAMVNRLSEQTLRNYFSGRSRARASEPALYLTAHENYLAYSKGAIVLNAIKELIGEDTLNKALKTLLIKHKNGATATSLDFLDELYQVTPKEKHILIDDWTKRVITYDFSIKTATYKKLSENKYEMKATISAQRYQTTKNGKEEKILINELITIGVFNKSLTNFNKNEALYLKSRLINKNEIEFSCIVNEVPKYISIDPYITRLDRTISDNRKMIELE
jgi:aminopeptidase N